MIPLKPAHIVLGTSLSSQWKQACLFEKKPCLFYLTLVNVPCTRYSMSLFCMAHYSQGKKSNARGITVHLSANACGCRSCKEYITLLKLKSCSFVPLSREPDLTTPPPKQPHLAPSWYSAIVPVVWGVFFLFLLSSSKENIHLTFLEPPHFFFFSLTL